MKQSKPKERVPISTGVDKATYSRIAKLRVLGWKITEILKLGIEVAEEIKTK